MAEEGGEGEDDSFRQDDVIHEEDALRRTDACRRRFQIIADFSDICAKKIIPLLTSLCTKKDNENLFKVFTLARTQLCEDDKCGSNPEMHVVFVLMFS